MKNVLISILLFIILVVSIFYFDATFTSLCNEIIASCIKIESYLEDNNKFEAYEESIHILEYINEKESIPSIYLSHIDYDSLINESLRLCLYIQKGELGEAFASVHILRNNAHHLRELQRPTIENIL